MPHRKFLLLGSEWNKYEHFDELLALSNFTYAEAPYEDYPSNYDKMDVFVSPSRLEGGPVPLIEAMMSNVVPVASAIGFAPDIILSSKNGFLFELDDPIERICSLVEAAFEIRTDVRQTVEHLSWERYARRLEEIFQPAATVHPLHGGLG